MAASDIEKLDDLIHGRLRLGIMAYLANAETASFAELQKALKASPGNLSVQIRKLEEAGYVHVDKRIVGRRPLTTARLLPKGREAFSAYLKALMDVVGNSKPD
jgi:DNA-binding MarR family transcriptional regulator